VNGIEVPKSSGPRRHGAGVLVVAADTGRVLLQKRSERGSEPGMWAVWGGMADPGETPRHAALRELKEETGYDGGFLRFGKIYTYRAPAFTYHNFLLIVPSEFRPHMNTETDAAMWCPISRLPKPLHYGMTAMMEDSYAWTAVLRATGGSGRRRRNPIQQQLTLFERERAPEAAREPAAPPPAELEEADDEDPEPVAPGKAKKKRAPERPKPGNAESWWVITGQDSAPKRGEKGFVETPLLDRYPWLEESVARAIQAYEDPDLGPTIGLILAEEGLDPDYGGDYELRIDREAREPEEGDDEEDWYDARSAYWSLADVMEYIGVDEEDTALRIFMAIRETFQGEHDHDLMPEYLKIGIVSDALDEDLPGHGGMRRLVPVSKELAIDFIEKTHSELPKLNVKGLLYAVGVAVGGRLVAVAAANTPGGRWGSKRCPPDGVLDLSRIASDGTEPFASSMLASRIMDLLPRSGRFGVTACLFSTYSLISEYGTTYLSLANRGLRPASIAPGKKKMSGARRSAGDSALAYIDKVRWEYGPAAEPPDWGMMRSIAAIYPAREHHVFIERAFERGIDLPEEKNLTLLTFEDWEAILRRESADDLADELVVAQAKARADQLERIRRAEKDFGDWETRIAALAAEQANRDAKRAEREAQRASRAEP
jgi:8-oxo-dGTP diphosphatase